MRFVTLPRTTYSITLLFLFLAVIANGQVKIGTNVSSIDSNSILELESNNSALVITRMSDTEMNAIIPLNGALVYNTDTKCVFVFEGSIWKNLCTSGVMVITAPTPPTGAATGDIWINDTNNKVYVWDGAAYVPITKNPRNGDGPPDNATISDATAGDLYVENTSGDIYTYDGNDWIIQTINVTNGLTKTTNNTVELGGSLNLATEIGTDATNTLAIIGLEEETENNNALVTVEENTGILRKVNISELLKQEEIVIIANDAQTQFSPPLTITSSQKLNVYRNGVKLGFTVIDDTTIELENPVVCYQNDEIRIVQFY